MTQKSKKTPYTQPHVEVLGLASPTSILSYLSTGGDVSSWETEDDFEIIED